MNEPKQQDKPFDISKWAVWKAYQRVKANKGAAGVDDVSFAEFEQDRDKHLYRIWNRMSSGSYFPPPVKAVEIPKAGGKGVRVLGVPTISDRIAQTVAKMYLEPKVEPVFHPDSYGYRPGKSTLDAVGTCRQRCWRADCSYSASVEAAKTNISLRNLPAIAGQTSRRNAVNSWLAGNSGRVSSQLRKHEASPTQAE